MLERLRRRLNALEPWQRTLVTIASFVISTFLLSFFFGDLIFALVLMICVTWHELCHLHVYRRYGIKGGIIFLAFLALTYGAGDKDFRWDKVSKAVWTAAAGVIGTLALALVLLGASTLLTSGWLAWILAFIAWINLILALFNLAPGLGMDGEKITKIITYAYRETASKDAAIILIIADIIGILGTQVMVSLAKMPSFAGMLIIVMFAFDLLEKARRHQVEPISEGLTQKEATIFAAMYLGLVLLALLGLWLMPLLAWAL